MGNPLNVSIENLDVSVGEETMVLPIIVQAQKTYGKKDGHTHRTWRPVRSIKTVGQN